MKIIQDIQPESLNGKLTRFWELSGEKINKIEREFDTRNGSPVFTIQGKYATIGWTEWTQGFQYGSAILQFDATGDKSFLEQGRRSTIDHMDSHLGHFGVHDHGFNNISTYGNLLRLMKEGKIKQIDWEESFYKLALKLSGAVQAKRWTAIPDGGFIYSFNGPHSLFVDTIRSLRSLVVSHELGYSMWSEHDEKINLLERVLLHAQATAKYSVFYGEGRDSFDIWGRTAHEAIFNTNDGKFRSPNSQQGYSAFSTWTRGLAWAMTGFSELLEYLETIDKIDLEPYGGFTKIESIFLKAAQATCDFYIENSAKDGIPYWDTGAPNLHQMGDYRSNYSEPYNDFEPVDSSAASIGSQGLLRLGHYLQSKGHENWKKYWQAGLTVAHTLLDEPYISIDRNHHGLILHSIYHHPNGWDYIPNGSKIPNGESSMWGDYHARELVLYLQKIVNKSNYYTFFNCIDG